MADYSKYTGITMMHEGAAWGGAGGVRDRVNGHLKTIEKDGMEVIEVSTVMSSDSDSTKVYTTITYGKRKPTTIEGLLNG